MPLALYVHIPFCETKCPYCDFNTYAAIESLMPAYVDALENEIAQWGAWLERPPLTSLFFGGGTPSYLPTRDIRRLMRAIHAAFDLPHSAEATLEANPGDCSRERLQAIRDSGINRLSIGVQSFDDHELRLLGRRHSVEQAIAAVEAARVAGFDNLSIDLMFGLPNQYAGSWAHSLDEAVALAPDHVSAYALTLEGGTPMEADVARGRLAEPDPDLAAEMYRMTIETLVAAGYAQYEISNWAKPGRESTHNLAYWRNQSWLGLGPGAHSYLLPTGAPEGAEGDSSLSPLRRGTAGGSGAPRGANRSASRSQSSRPGAPSPFVLSAKQSKDTIAGNGATQSPTGSPLTVLPPHGIRFANLKPPRTYIDRVRTWRAIGPLTADAIANAPTVDFAETPDARTAMGETMMMGLRLNEGIADAEFVTRFGIRIADAFPQALQDCLDDGLLEWTSGRLRLTETGRPLGNEAFARFVDAARA